MLDIWWNARVETMAPELMCDHAEFGTLYLDCYICNRRVWNFSVLEPWLETAVL